MIVSSSVNVLLSPSSSASLNTKVKIHTTSWLIEKALLVENHIRFPEGVSWGEDFEFFCEVLASTTHVCFVNKYLTNYRSHHSDSQLSNFSLDKIDKDFESIMRVVNNKKTASNELIQRALIDYRLQALIVYRLVTAASIGIDLNRIREYYVKYQEYITKPTFNNGLRSAKLSLNKMRLRRIIRR